MALRPSIIGLGGGPTILTRSLATFGIIAPEWGIFTRGGKAVVTADNVVSFEYKQEFSIADYPVEEGAFESYDKVQTPYDVRLRFSSGGSFNNRQALINSIQTIAGDLKLYDAVTPEKTYTKVNVAHQDYGRTAQNGAGLLMIDVWLTQIRVTTSTKLTSTAKPSGAEPMSGGQVQPQQPTKDQIAIADRAIAAGA